MRHQCQLCDWEPRNGAYHISAGRSRYSIRISSTEELPSDETQTLICTSPRDDMASYTETTPFNFSTDILAIKARDLSKISRNDTTTVFQGLESVTRLLVLQECCACGAHILKTAPERMAMLLSQFVGLRELYVEVDKGGPYIQPVLSIKPVRAPDAEFQQEFDARKTQFFQERESLGGSKIEMVYLVKRG